MHARLQHNPREQPLLPSKTPLIGHLLETIFHGLSSLRKSAYVFLLIFQTHFSEQSAQLDRFTNGLFSQRRKSDAWNHHFKQITPLNTRLRLEKNN
jgi:hypothetical protein